MEKSFVHLHVHSQYSILDGAASIKDLVKKAKADNMPALALTDHGNMFGIKEFYDVCKKEKIKPILGCETYVATKMSDKAGREDRSGDHLILLAKNEKGYRNLLKLVSTANIEGFYYKPRIDKELLAKHSEGLIVSSACLGGEVPQCIMNNRLDEAREVITWYKNLFGDDYYLEMMYHPAEELMQHQEISVHQMEVNKIIAQLANEMNVKLVVTNDVHFTNAEDADAHDLLICMNTGKDLDDPQRMRYTKQEWFKTTEEMYALWAEQEEALKNTVEIAEKVEHYELNSDPIMPIFPLPDGYPAGKEGEGMYLRHLTIEGAKIRYGDPIPEKALERINFELETIINMGFPGYFLIVQDFINKAREMGVLVGPGRGSAAGAAVAYCTGITNVDPIKFDLLFERFLNPDRISMPDVDIDFDDDGRQSVIDYVTQKYGQDKVAHICTFGTMAAKSSIKDVARVLKLPLSEAIAISNLVPDTPKITLKKSYIEVPELLNYKNSPDKLVADTIRFAETLEGSVRQYGVHACGILISRDPLDHHIPVMPTKGENLLTTQYDGHFVEAIGLLKMDFLGLKTLSIIKETLDNIQLSKNISVDIDKIPLDDELTFKLFSNGDTTAIFQFESPGMKKHLRSLEPNRFEDLVAMNALYRPGPMEYIPDYIDRKHGRKAVVYDHPLMEQYLNDTYGITVFQEQVMLLSRLLGGFTRGESDTLRKAMGKKQLDLMEKLKVKFQEGCKNNPDFMSAIGNNIKEADAKTEKIWKDWEAFASYAFNKSHSVCYAYVAYQTGYLKAHYPAEFMAGVLSRNLSDITKISTFMDECKRMGMKVLGPDVNESFRKFTVNAAGALRFGMAGIKGVGEGVVEEIIRVRKESGPFVSIYDFVERVNLGVVNKKGIEALAMSGGFDEFVPTRSAFIATAAGEDGIFLDNLVKYGNLYQSDKDKNQNSLFGDVASTIAIKKPTIPKCEEFSLIEKLNREKDLIGIFLSAHPLDNISFELEYLCNTQMEQLNDLPSIADRDFTVGGMVIASRVGTTKTGKPFGILTVEDYSGSFEFALFGEDYMKQAAYFRNGLNVMIKGRVEKRKWGNQELEAKINSIQLIDEELRRKLVNSISITLPLQEINQTLIEDFSTLLEEKGSVLVHFIVKDLETNQHIKLFSRKAKIDISNTLIQFVKEKEGFSFQIN